MRCVMLAVAVMLAVPGMGEAAPKKAAPKRSSIEEQVIRAAKDSVLIELMDPKSAQFGRNRVYREGDDYVVCGSVNAKNSYGGYVGSKTFMSVVKQEVDAKGRKYFEGNVSISGSDRDQLVIVSGGVGVAEKCLNRYVAALPK